MSNHLDLLFDHLRFPSISTDSSHRGDMGDCAGWLSELLTQGGFSVEICETAGHPAVIAKGPQNGNRPKVMIYGHYDVQPVDPIDLWESPPFQPEVRDGIIYGRGSTDNKGQHLAHILGAIEALKSDGDLPVDLTFLIEGEEEIGSPNLEPLIESRKDDFACDVIAISDTGMVAPGMGTLTYSLRGIACLEFTVSGPSGDLHSGIWGGAVANPATIAAKLVASLHEPSGRIAIPGFYDKVGDLADWEREAWAKLPGGAEETMEITGVPALSPEDGFTELECRWARPTAEINGIGGGYQGEGSKTIVPQSAFAKVSFRLVPGQDPREITELAEAHLRAHCPPSVKLEVKAGHDGAAYLTDPHGRWGVAAQKALKGTFGGDIALIREGGSIPIVQSFKDVLGADTLLLGLALPDCQAHAPNENFPVANFEAGIRLNRDLLAALAEG